MISPRIALLLTVLATPLVAQEYPRFGTMRANEGDNLENRIEVTLTLSQPPSVPFSVRVYSTPVTASQGGDYKRLNEEVTFRPGLRSAKVPIIIYGDERHEADETFRLDVEGLGMSALFTIVDDDEPNSLPAVLIDETDVIEGTGTRTVARFRVTLSEPSLDGATVRFETVSRGAVGGADFVEQSGFLQFKAGERVKWIEVEVIADDQPEYEWEFFDVDLTSAKGANIERAFASGRIRDDDDLDVRWLKIHDAIAIEGTTAVFRLELSRPADTPLVVRWAVAEAIDQFLPGPRAKTPADFAQKISAITFAPGEVLKEIAVPTTEDVLTEADEYFGLFVGPTPEIEYDSREGRGIIIDDDTDWGWPSLHVEDRFVVESDGWTDLDVPLRLSRPSDVPASVTVTTREPGELDFLDTRTTITFEPGETEKTLRLRVRGDDVAEPLKYFNLDFGEASGMTINRDSITISIVDDDRPSRDRAVRH